MKTSFNEPESAPPSELPELHSTVLGEPQVLQLLDDIESCAELEEILPKFAAQAVVPDSGAVTLSQAREMLTGRTVRGLQIRYRYDGADWWDTILVLGDQFRVVRIRHDFGSTQ